MSISIDFPPAIERDVKYCADERGMSFAQFVFELVSKEAARIRQERARRVKPNVRDFIGYGLQFDPKPMSTAEYMAEMREGEQVDTQPVKRLKIGSMKDEIHLPENFDQAFEKLDSQVASMFKGVAS